MAQTMGAAGPERPWPELPGPADRTSFFEEQARHRRAAGRYAWLCSFGVLLASIPLTLVLAPVLFTLGWAALSIARLVVPIPPAVWTAAAALPNALMTLVEALDHPPFPIGVAVQVAAMLLLPSLAAMTLIGWTVRSLFFRAGVGAALLGLGAREPQLTDLEERQLVNVVEEMALAAGLPAPRVRLLDGPAANAAAIGSGPGDATVVVSRRLLDELDRDETQGVLAHLVGSIGNGDLRLALTIVTVWRTFALVTVLLDAPVSPSARATLWRLLGVMVARRRGPAETELVLRLLTERAETVELEDVDRALADAGPSGLSLARLRIWLTRARVYALFPLWVAGGLAKTALMLLSSFLLGPFVSLLWRRRRHLADATAVQLTRNPAGLAHGLLALGERGGIVAGGQWATHLFIVGPEAARARVLEQWAAKRREVRERDGLRAMAEQARAEAYSGRLAEELAASADHSELSGTGSAIISFHPSLESRLQRLRAMGAQVDVAAWPHRGAGSILAGGGVMLLVGPLLLLAAGLMVVALGLMIGMVCFFMLVYVLLVYAVFAALNGLPYF